MVTTTPNFGLRKLLQRHLKDEAYEVLKSAITSLALPPGQPCMESELAAALGISKTPVRHALARLEREGLVVTVPFKGTFVRDVTVDDVREILEVRGGLEPLAVRLWIERVPREEMGRLREIIDSAERLAHAGAFEAAMNAIRDFHEVLIGRVGNQRLTAIFTTLEDQLVRIRNICGHIPGRIEQSCREHRETVEAIEARDVARAQRACLNHLTSLLASYTERANQVIEGLAEPWQPPRLGKGRSRHRRTGPALRTTAGP